MINNKLDSSLKHKRCGSLIIPFLFPHKQIIIPLKYLYIKFNDMIYLKEFSTENDYVAYRDSSNYLKPNVSLSDDNGNVYYNFTPPQ